MSLHSGVRAGGLLICLLLAQGFGLVSVLQAGMHEASTAPDGAFLLKVYPRFYYTSAYFSDAGRALNLEDVTGLLYFELPLQVQYGLTGRFAIGAELPLGWSYEERDSFPTARNRLTVREIWLSLQYRTLTFPLIASSEIMVKIPVADSNAWEYGLRLGDGQVDLFPMVHFDYYSSTQYWFLQMTGGYRYRFESDGDKPLDEIRIYGQGGYELFPDLRMRFYLFADLTKFTNGSFPGGASRFFEREGALHHFGYGVSLWPRPSFRLEITTGGDWSGTNQYRGIRWEIGLTKIL